MTQTTDTEPCVAPASGRKVTFEEFLELESEETRTEWVDGEVIELTKPSRIHQRLAGFLAALMRHFAEAHHQGEVIEEFLMKLDSRPAGRVPDILFVANENLNRMKENHLVGPADLAVEIISPDSRGSDRGDKYYEYESGGVREYWLLDPKRKRAEFYQLGADGKYNLIAPTNGLYHSAVLSGLWLKVDWLWEDPLPPLLDVLKQWDIL